MGPVSAVESKSIRPIARCDQHNSIQLEAAVEVVDEPPLFFSGSKATSDFCPTNVRYVECHSMCDDPRRMAPRDKPLSSNRSPVWFHRLNR